MNAQHIWTPEEILAERAADAAAGKLAHTGNSWGFSARSGCPCYNCRGDLDPTGEEDAADRNAPPPAPEPEPAPAPALAEPIVGFTAAEILAQRQAKRAMGIIAHTPNVEGDFMARFGCACYNCRDFLDSTGENDAAASRVEYRPVSLAAAATGASY